jgi:GNAT superfamily N-acetyltransferase
VFATIRVDPALRRRGIGRFLFEEVVEYARRDGRSVIVTDSADRPEYAAFAAAMGQERVYEEVVRRQNLLSLDWSRLDREYAEAQVRAEDYGLIRIAGPTPPDLLERVATLTAAINDAPHTSEIDMEDEVFTPERIREFEAAQQARDIRIYRVAALHKASGELAGHTVVGIDADQPWYASQYDTSVLESHRGHRLGLLLKIDMLRWLADDEPQLRELNTANAGTNAHMISVNETLGYEVLDRSIAWQRKLQE